MMDRQIQFRAKRIGDGQWVFGSFVLDAANSPRIASVDSSGRGLDFHEVEADTVGQFANLQDAVGVEIYEGDILATHGTDNSLKYVVKQDPETLGLSAYLGAQANLLIGKRRYWRVIGNIHDKEKVIGDGSASTSEGNADISQ